MSKGEEINHIYKKLKQAIYYNPDLFLRHRMAEYESDYDNFGLIKEKKIDDILSVLMNNGEISEQIREEIDSWIESISYNLLPKKIEISTPTIDSSKNNPIFISNILSSSKYSWSKANYFIDAPIPLLILDILWVMKVGSLLESEIGDCCYANRIHDHLINEIENPKMSTSHVFKNFGDQYSAWKNNALDVAELSMENNETATIVSLDFTSFFYCININFEKIKQKIIQNYDDDKSKIPLFLNEVLEKIHKKYMNLIREHILITHSEIFSQDKIQERHVLPIGLFSSGILANWHLIDFDKDIIEKINPRYYGRYVDDCIVVISQHKYQETEIMEVENTLTVADAIIKKYFCQTEILKEKNEDPLKYVLSTSEISEIEIQNDKIKIFTIDPDHSRAILKMIKKHFQ
jgi:Reverse transcriptase (RNA-dependent DNA polymerase).